MIAIEAHNLSKRYHLGSTVERRYKTLRDSLGRVSSRLLRRQAAAPARGTPGLDVVE